MLFPKYNACDVFNPAHHIRLKYLAERCIYPAIDINRSKTRREELLMPPEEFERCWLLRKVLNEMNASEAVELLVERMKKTDSNNEFLTTLSR